MADQHKQTHPPERLEPIRVFLSGPFRDMELWRGRARGSVEMFDGQFLSKGLEYRVTDHRTIQEIIETDLAPCEIYLGIYGVRYGSRVNNVNNAPSYSHWEYLWFYHREIRQRKHSGAAMLILHPEIGSDAHTLVKNEADPILASLTPALREADRIAMEEFRAQTELGKQPITIALPQELAELDVLHNEVAHGVQTYRCDKTFVSAIYEFLLGRLAKGITTREPLSEAAPELGTLPAPEPQMLRFLRGDPRPAAVCVITENRSGFDARSHANALARANPWGAERIDLHVDLAAGRRDDDPSTPPVHWRVLEPVIAALELGLRPDRDGTIASIAEEIAINDEPLMVCVHGIEVHPGALGFFLTEIWPMLEKAIRHSRGEAGSKHSAILMIMSYGSTIGRGLRKRLAVIGATAPTAFDRPFVMPEGETAALRKIQEASSA